MFFQLNVCLPKLSKRYPDEIQYILNKTEKYLKEVCPE